MDLIWAFFRWYDRLPDSWAGMIALLLIVGPVELVAALASYTDMMPRTLPFIGVSLVWIGVFVGGYAFYKLRIVEGE